ncbi:MAG: prolipoprotein diacylglyceryl transferase family protein, partial [Candidatus Omnitrophota bacterium]
MHPIICSFGPVYIYSYGVMVAVAFGVAYFLIWRNAGRFGVDRVRACDLLVYVMISGIAGARLFHVMVNAGFYLKHPFEIFMLTRGGLAFYGGLAAACAFTLFYVRRFSLPLWTVADLFAPYIALGQAIGRIGCYFNGCCYGGYCPEGHYGIMLPGEEIARYPVQLYASIALVLIYCVLRFMQEKGILRGSLFAV